MSYTAKQMKGSKSAREIAADALNAALYTAATKAGMDADLRRAQVEVFVSRAGGAPYIYWEHELCEDERFVPPHAAIARAEKWLAAYMTTDAGGAIRERLAA